LGFEDVRSLRHGIIGYQRWNEEDGDTHKNNETEGSDSLWIGENFLFDKRRLAKGEDESNEV
jgi:predicted sulfurtransferase